MTTRTAKKSDALDMARLVDTRGRAYREFRRGLAPRYARVWSGIALAYLGLGVSMAALTRITDWPLAGQCVAAACGALVIGYAIAFIGLFIHEAAHYNVATPRSANDRLANLLIGVLVATDVRRYRLVHMQHHKYLGTPQDPERSYFSPLNLRFMVEALTGIRVLRVLLVQRKHLEADARGESEQAFFPVTLLGSIGLHAAVVVGCLWLGFWAAALAWAVGTAVVFPFFASLRQLLEHRSRDADAQADYSQIAHGQTNRLFGDGLLASTLGGAGFNRHLLHHWDPAISCTRLREVEQFLLDSDAAGTVRAHQTSYWHAFKGLYAH